MKGENSLQKIQKANETSGIVSELKRKLETKIATFMLIFYEEDVYSNRPRLNSLLMCLEYIFMLQIFFTGAIARNWKANIAFDPVLTFFNLFDLDFYFERFLYYEQYRAILIVTIIFFTVSGSAMRTIIDKYAVDSKIVVSFKQVVRVCLPLFYFTFNFLAYSIFIIIVI